MLTDKGMQDSVSKRTGSTLQTKVRWTKFREQVDLIIAGNAIEPRFFSLQFRQRLFNESSICKLCNNQIHTFEDSTVDHLTPYSKGGRTVESNAQLAHRSCNASKNASLMYPVLSSPMPA